METLKDQFLDADDSDGFSDPEPRIVNPRFRSGPGIIPLLETISTIEDLCDDSEESCDGTTENLKGPKTETNESDPTGYAGSDSIDSGYKSSCPTPDPDPSTQRLNQLNTLRHTLINAIHKHQSGPSKDPSGSRQGRPQGRLQGQAHPQGHWARPRSLSANPQDRVRGSIPQESIDMLEEEIDMLLHGRRLRLENCCPGENVPVLGDKPGQNGRVHTVAGRHVPPAASVAPVAKTQFSRVARCMIEIIEDLHRKYGDQQLPSNSPGNSPGNSTGVTDRKPKVSMETPDFHVYEEIIYDVSPSAVSIPKKVSIPPPLPARPGELNRGSATKKPWFSVLNPLKKDRVQNSRNLGVPRRVAANEYTFSSGSRPPYPLPRSAQDQGVAKLNPANKIVDDEYGFKIKIL